jgi:protein transport protein SEC61 subunit gamma-like protein
VVDPAAVTRMEALSLLSKPIVDFAEKSVRLWKRCTKPDQKEYARVAQAVLLGILLLGLIGYFIRLIHIPINNILLG